MMPVYHIYTYVRRPYMGVNPSGEYLIGQMPLPKGVRQHCGASAAAAAT